MRFQLVGAGKGSAFRPVDKGRFDSEYERIFGKWKPRGEVSGKMTKDRASVLDDSESSISKMMRDKVMVRMIREDKASDPGLKREAERIERENSTRPRRMFLERKQKELESARIELRRSQRHE